MPSIREVYDDPRVTTRNPKLLAQRAGVAVASAQAFLRKQASAQTSEQWRKPSQHSHSYAPTGAPADNYQSDVVFMSGFGGVNDKRRAILTLLNTTTRFAAARAILSAKAPAVAAGMASILDELAGQGRSVSVMVGTSIKQIRLPCSELGGSPSRRPSRIRTIG